MDKQKFGLIKKKKNYLTIEEELLLLREKGSKSPLSVEEILHILSGKGRSLILILLSLPFCQPIQIPGFSTPFGLAIAFVGLRMTFGKHAWLPKKILAQTIPPHTLQKMTEKTLWLVKKMKRWVRPRFAWLCHYPASQILNGLLIAILGILLALPLPIPLSNLTSAWSLFFIGLGTLEDDGIFIFIGYLISLFTCLFFISMVLSINSFF